MTVGGIWGSIEFFVEDDQFDIIVSDGKDSVEAPFRKDQGPKLALEIMELSGFGQTNAAAQLRAEVSMVEQKRAEDQEIIRWLQETKGETGWIVSKQDRIDFAKQKKFWGRGEGC